MNREEVGSREYKIMLRTRRFMGDEQELVAKARNFWSSFRTAVQDAAKGAAGDLTTVAQEREIVFYDTEGLRLRANGYVFRDRKDSASGKREVTLKFRHPDRYVSQDRNMDARDAARGRSKFEEDIKPAFRTLYSHSTKQKISRDMEFATLGDLVRLYPGLPGRMDQYNRAEPLVVVGGFTARERVIEGAVIRLRKGRKWTAGCALIAWYAAGGPLDRPVAVEFSYRYGSKQEKYPRAAAARAFRTFELMQTGLPTWVAPGSKTKTAYVYSRAGSDE